jgi:hypothetical protein
LEGRTQQHEEPEEGRQPDRLGGSLRRAGQGGEADVPEARGGEEPDNSDITYIPLALIDSIERGVMNFPKKEVRNYAQIQRWFGDEEDEE